jgi:hypothetical protein
MVVMAEQTVLVEVAALLLLAEMAQVAQAVMEETELHHLSLVHQ